MPFRESGKDVVGMLINRDSLRDIPLINYHRNIPMSPPNLRYRFIDYPPDPDGTHQGTGDISYPPMLVVPASVPGHVADLLDFNNPTCNISVLCMVLDTPQQPNWYGIAYRKGIQSFDSVNIFCHPHPGNAGMQDKDYQGRGGNWRHLFRYAQNLGMQLAPANSNQILVVPFFSNAVYHNGGIFAPNWREILTVAAIGVKASLGIPSAFRSKIDLQVAAEAVRNHTTTTVVNNVVVSAFSYGRVLSATIRSAMPGLRANLREIWDFGGAGTAPPSSSATVKAILYDEASADSPSHGAGLGFHVPKPRWKRFPPAMAAGDVHGFIPNMLLWHAATESGVGH